MNTRKKTQFMTMTALLTAIAILIPIVMPFKIVIPPASYTLGSHIAIFIAMFLSPLMAVLWLSFFEPFHISFLVL